MAIVGDIETIGGLLGWGYIEFGLNQMESIYIAKNYIAKNCSE